MMELAARVALATVALWWVGIGLRTRPGSGGRPFHLGPEHPPLPPGERPRVSVIIPARNEASNLGPCLESVLAQEDVDLQVVVLDDASSDGTAQVARRYPQVQLMEGRDEPPPGWLGKPWAVHRAQAAATAPWLVFLDADVRLHPRALSRAVAWARDKGVDMVSGLGRLETRGFWEKTLQPVIGGLILSTVRLHKVNDPAWKGKIIANGQFILVRREVYAAFGGHEAVKGQVVDDVELVKAARASGARYHCLFMQDLFSCRMYDGLAQIWRGWRKNLFPGLDRSWVAVLVVCAVLLAQGVVPYGVLALALGGLLSPEWLAWGGGTVAVVQAVRYRLDRVHGLDPWYGLTQVAAYVLVVGLILDSAWSGTFGRVAWKGRSV